MPVIATLLAAFACGWLIERLRMPGGMMIGAMIGACLYGILGGAAAMPDAAKFAAQVIAGAYIGTGISRRELRDMRTVLRPAAILLPALLAINVAAGLLMRRLFGMDLLTALLGCAPGGMNDIPIIAADMGADAAQVFVLQFVRLITGIAIFPALVRITLGREGEKQERMDMPEKAQAAFWPAVATLLIAAGFGYLGRVSPMPSGTMAFAVLGTMLLRLAWPPAQVPFPLRRVAQCLSGAYIGASLGPAQLAAIPGLFGPALLLIACYVIGGMGVAWAFVRTGCFKPREAMLAATPAGATDMALIAADLGIRNVKLVLLQLLRLVIVISFFPTILSMIAGN